MTETFYGLDSRGAIFVRERLRFANPLGEKLLVDIRIEKGRTYAVLPRDLSGDVYEFKHAIHRYDGTQRVLVEGGQIQRVLNTKKYVSEWIAGVLVKESRFRLVCESYNLRAADIPDAARKVSRSVSYLTERVATYEDFVYMFALGIDSREEIASVVNVAYEIPVGLGVLFEAPLDWNDGPPGRVSSLSSLEGIVAGVQMILLSAYDGESVVVWISDESRCDVPRLPPA
jgi:hypothetical protein